MSMRKELLFLCVSVCVVSFALFLIQKKIRTVENLFCFSFNSIDEMLDVDIERNSRFAYFLVDNTNVRLMLLLEEVEDTVAKEMYYNHMTHMDDNELVAVVVVDDNDACFSS